MLRAFASEPVAFWAVSFYLFIEYVRPQQVWRAIDVLPWGDLALGGTAVAFVLYIGRLRKGNLADGLLALFSLIVLLSMVFARYPDVSFREAEGYWLWIVVYFLVTHIVTTERRLFLFWGLFLLFSLKMSQHGTRLLISRGFGFADWGATGAPGWFHNSGEFAIQMCIFFPMGLYFCLAFRDRWPRWKFWGMMALLPGTALLALVATSSRGGQLAGAVVVLFMVARSRYRVRGLVTAALVIAAGWLITSDEQKDRFRVMGDDETSQARLTYWRHGREIAARNPLLGIGYKNWLPYYLTRYGEGEVPHNIFIEAASELGYTGFLSFLLLIGATFVLNARTRRVASASDDWATFLRHASMGLDAALIGYLVAGFFVTVLYYPFFWMNLTLAVCVYQVALRRRAGIRRGMSRSTPVATPTVRGAGVELR